MKHTDVRDACFQGIYDIIAQDKNAIIITADHSAFILDDIEKDFPNQYINVGIAEQNLMAIASGLALCGKKIFAYGIASFVIARCFDQVNIDVSGMNLDVCIIGIGTGFTYNTDGPTHHGTQDVAIASAIPNLNIFNITDAASAYSLVKLAHKKGGPFYLRLGKGTPDTIYSHDDSFEDGIRLIEDGEQIIVSSGSMVYKALEASKILKSKGESVGVVDVYRLKPLNKDLLSLYLADKKMIIVVEDNIASGGLGEKISSLMHHKKVFVPLKQLAISDCHCFQYFCKQSELEDYYGIGIEDIISL